MLGRVQKATAFFSESAMASVSCFPPLFKALPGEGGRNKQKSALELIWTVRPVGYEPTAVVVVVFLVVVVVFFVVVVFVAEGPLQTPLIQSSQQSD